MSPKGLLGIAAILFLVSCSENHNAISVSNWQVLYSQSENIDDVYLSESWRNIDLRQPVHLPYSQKHAFQYLWLKGSFAVAEDHEDLYGISIPKLFLVDRVYINGNLIGYLHEEEISNLDSPRNYTIPSGTISKGKNHVHIRAGVYDKWDVEMAENVLIQDAESFRTTRKQYHLFSEIIPLSILTLIIGTFFSLLFKSANDRWNKEYLLLAFRLIIAIFCYLTFYSPIPIFSIKTIIAIWNMVLPLFFINMILFYQEIYKIHFEKINFIVIPFLAGLSAVVFLLNIINRFEGISQILIGFALAAAWMFICYILKAIIKNRQRDFKLALVLSDSIIISLNIVIVALFLFFERTLIDPSILSILSGLFLTILFSIYFARRDGLQKLKMDSLSARLKDIEAKSKNVQKYNISPALEKKLEEIIAFIRENFSASLSREELADTVGVNPNYFSSLFNIYTGKKVNEYINDLRLQKASEVLALQNDSVIDVAFSSGFESLSTFNRLFKRKFSCTPKEYRNQQGRVKK